MILVTGGATRIGAAILRRIVRDNKVVIHYHNSRDAAVALAGELGNAVVWQQDLRVNDLVSPFQQLVAQYGPVETLINNAAVFYPAKDDADQMTPELRHEIMTVNYHAPLVLMQEFARQLPESNKGNIINILDQRVLNPSRAFPAYTESKRALWNATKEMAVQFAPRIRVNAIAPGHVLPTQGEDLDKFNMRRTKVPLGYGPEPDEIAAAVEFILNSPSITGACIPVDSGEHLVKKQKTT